MLDELRTSDPTCDGDDCERELSAAAALVFRSEAGERRAYDSDCGAVPSRSLATVRGNAKPTP